jgi:hypothetical protein
MIAQDNKREEVLMVPLCYTVLRVTTFPVYRSQMEDNE